MKKILVTGAGGFIGSQLSELLVERGHSVKAFIRYNSTNQWGWLEQSERKNDIEIFAGDIRDYDSVWNALKGCDSVFHLAALIGIPYSYVSPIAYLKTNVEGTYNVLECARKQEIQNVVVTSTSETYGTAQYVPIDEKHPLVGQSPYSASKIAADQLSISYHRSFELPVKIVRPFNTYGPRQSARAIIPSIIIQILNGAKEIHVGNVSPTRDLTFVKDTVKGFLKISECAELEGQITNVGMNIEIAIGALAAEIGRLLGTKIVLNVDTERVRPKQSEVERLCCDNTKLKQKTGWEPDYNLESGLLETIKWFESRLQFYKPLIYNV